MSSFTTDDIAAPSSSKKMILLESSDKQIFEIEESIALKSEAIKNMIEDGCFEPHIPLPNVTANILGMFIEYLKCHQKAAEKAEAESKPIEDLKEFDAEFMKVDIDTLYDMLMAANYLNIYDLLELICQTVADKIKGKTPDEIRKVFNIKNDFSPEEEEEIRKENQWAFE